MKKIKILAATLLVASTMFTTSCSDDFLDTKASESVEESQVFATADGLLAAVNGMHRNMYSRQNSSQGQNGYTAQMIISEVMGDDLVFPATTGNWFVAQLRWLDTANANGSSNSYTWNFWYSMNKNANKIIVKGANATGDNATKERAFGEAYAYKAFSYFQLVQLYGKRYVKGGDNTSKGIILRNDPEDVAPKARVSVEEVYQEIWRNLDKAEELLKNKKVINNSHFSISNVYGLKARVALVQQDYANASKYAQLAKEGHPLMDERIYKSGFNDYKTDEWMWGITIVDDQTDYFGNFMAYMSRNYNSSNIRSNPKAFNSALYAKLADTDVRKQLVDPTGKHTDLGLPSNYAKVPYTSQKFLAVSTGDSRGDIVFMRASEMYLIEAEAKYFLGDEAGSKAVLTELAKMRDSKFDQFTKSGADYLEDIYVQRRAELWGEGFRFFDLKRQGRKLDRRGANHVSAVTNDVMVIEATDSRWQWLIPQDEINANPLCEQNPS
ncbi:RagB/SusD family nutrient uptake outer membrane protein [Empedobacter brevis]|uniref:Membrane protein n=3 Tax=Empedobacter brevis TaxID=247 RepID=A0A511NEB9_9FLAO|nr:RagB/SusD family nutrient uptake outer membrane protein [Empedobacter brevis]MDM1072368.1 RagB/SusD family nutrient uptake outer membrane protein [Empedobacter brevis]QES92318.1 RagB/SusD family nutrient uptake outer membrane protein [Empedobacter brevis]QHC84068.1 carbohydrate-binding protein SusD [Empedobacter brevis]GEM50858.1 membrane protein [Empedobacter brevis NBRC 14943 = ATCC 43319]